MTLHIWRCHCRLILTTPHRPRNEPLEHECIVVWSVTRNRLFCRQGVTIEDGEVATSTDPTMIHSLFLLGLTVVVDQLISRLGNGDMTNRWTNPEGRSNIEMQVIIRDFGSSICYECDVNEVCSIIQGETLSLYTWEPATPLKSIEAHNCKYQAVAVASDDSWISLRLWVRRLWVN